MGDKKQQSFGYHPIYGECPLCRNELKRLIGGVTMALGTPQEIRNRKKAAMLKRMPPAARSIEGTIS